jgi:hypothetical protein
MIYEQKTKPSFKERLMNRKNALGATAILAAFGAGFATNAELSSSNTSSSISALDKQREATHAATLEVKAFQTASDYEQTLNGDGAIKNAQVLTGLIEVNIDGKWVAGYQNAFLLARSSNTKPDKNGDFLKGAWLGVSSNDSHGDMVVTAVPFDTSMDRYVANGSVDQILPNTVVQGLPVKGGPGFSVDIPAVYNTQTHSVYQNPEGEDIFAGLSVGGK